MRDTETQHKQKHTEDMRDTETQHNEDRDTETETH